MLYIKPDYYDDFHCVAGDCEDTCCAGWQIVVDQDSLNRYKESKAHVKGPFRHQLNKGVLWHKGVFRQDKDKRCAFLNENNLCDMYTALGEDSLCLTCSRYPRHIEEFEDVRETTLSVSCPEVARYLIGRKEPVRFLYVETDEEESCEDFEDMNFDALLYDILEEGRQTMITILQQRQYSLKERLERILHLAYDMEEMMNQGEMFSCQELFPQYIHREKHFPKKRFAQPMKHSMRILGCLSRLEQLREDWRDLLDESASLLYLEGEEAYQKISSDFLQWQKESGLDLSIPSEQLAVYFVSTYFCGAVYDGQILAKVQASVLSTYIVSELWKAKWLKNEHMLDRDDLYEITYRFSRELEHSDKNLDLMEKLACAALPIVR